MSIKEFITQVQNNKIDILDYTEQVLSELETINKKHHYMNVISQDLARLQAKAVAKSPSGKLAGLPLSVKDNICVKGIESTAGSAILKGYKPVFHATVVEKLIKEGAIIVGKNAQDEFGFGGFNVNVGVGYLTPTHPLDEKRVTGGSSGGSAGIVAKTTLIHASLGESTGGSIETPAAYCGIVGMCPTYGLVSRYGLIDYGNSLDKIGPMTKTVDDAEYLFGFMTGKDPRDSTSIKAPTSKKQSVKTVGIVRALVNIASEDVKKGFAEAEKRLADSGVTIVDVELPVTTNYAMQVYYVLGLSEASTNLAKYCGMRYGATEKMKGKFDEYFSAVRSKHLGEEAKRRIILGSFARMAGYRDAFYIQAAKIRRKIIEEYKSAFKDCQVLLSPTNPLLAPSFEDMKKMSVLEMYNIDATTVGPNLAGIPHMSVPVSMQKKLPVGAMVMADHFCESSMFECAKRIEMKNNGQ